MLTSRLTLAVLTATLLFTIGCSRDRHELNSTHHLPATLLIIDTVNDKTVWSMEIPVGQRLVYDFEYEKGVNDNWGIRTSNVPANSMKWWLYPSYVQGNYQTYHGKVLDEGEVPLNGAPIRTEVVYRDTGRVIPPPSLTSPEEAANLPPIRLELEVLSDGSIVFDGKPRRDEAIGNAFRSLYGERRVIITGRPGTPRESLIALEKNIVRKDLVTVVIPPAPDGEAGEPAQDQKPAEESKDADADHADAIDEAMEGK